MGKAKLTLIVGLILASIVIAPSCQYFPDSWKFWQDEPPMELGVFSWRSSLPGLAVELTPTDETRAYRTYTLDLYERGDFRESTTVSWNAAELNGGWIKYALFVLNRPEDAEYRYRTSEDLADIFSVKIRG